jgi:type IV pilus assembly protein PilC
MALMLASGLDADHSLDMAEKLAGGGPMHRKIQACRHLVAGGVSFADALEKTGIFTGVYSRMLGVGFRTGRRTP